MPSSAIISNIESLLTGSGQRCSVGASQGLCTYSMLCTFAKVRLMLTSSVIILTFFYQGTHLGTCRDRFIFGSCCQMPKSESSQSQPTVEAVEAEEECGEQREEEVAEVCGRRNEEGQEGRIQGGSVANR